MPYILIMLIYKYLSHHQVSSIYYILDAVADTEETTSELEKYWKAVKDNPSDFTGWTYLLQYVEQEVS